MDADSQSKPSPSTGRFAILTNPVRGFAQRAVGRAWPRRPAGNPVSNSASPNTKGSNALASDAIGSKSVPGKPPDDTPAQPFVTSEVISAFHLQQLHLPSSFDRATKGVMTGGKVAIIASIFALISLVGFDFLKGSPGVDKKGVPPPSGSPQASAATPASAGLPWEAAVPAAVSDRGNDAATTRRLPPVHTAAPARPDAKLSNHTGPAVSLPRAAVPGLRPIGTSGAPLATPDPVSLTKGTGVGTADVGVAPSTVAVPPTGATIAAPSVTLAPAAGHANPGASLPSVPRIRPDR